MTTVALSLNGRRMAADVEPRTHLADLIRESHNCTGTHLGCEHGVCGACTVLIDGEPARSCITFALACENAEVVTIEGLDEDEVAAELRAAFTREHALQCGYCTPGMIVSARDVVLRMEAPSEHEIRVAMSGNLCRCTGYVGIVRAVQSVVADRRARGIAARRGDHRRWLGPVGSGHAAETEATVVATKRATAPAEAPAPPRVDEDWRPQATLAQSFAVAYPADEVFAFFGRLDEVAACLPGATIDTVSDGHVEGRIRVKVGPISAEFQGVADVTRDEAARSGTINGAGRDRKSNSATRGLIRYRVSEREGGAKVDVDVGYALTGALAQFGRSGLVKDVANRLTEAFAKNLEARLAHRDASGDAPPPAAAELDAGSLFGAVARGWFAGLWRRLTGRTYTNGPNH